MRKEVRYIDAHGYKIEKKLNIVVLIVIERYKLIKKSAYKICEIIQTILHENSTRSKNSNSMQPYLQLSFHQFLDQ